jgi:biotin transporter BioY
MLNLNGDLTVGYVAGFIAAAIVVGMFASVPAFTLL